MENNVISIRSETVRAFLPEELHDGGRIDLHELSLYAKVAMEGSEQSLKAAENIADGNAITRWWNSGEMQKHIIQSITYLGGISKVNLGLSAICNDLAAANLENAQRIDQNHVFLNQQLRQVQQLTGELLDHLRRPREPSLLENLAPLLSSNKPTGKEDVQAWLRTLTEEIDLQYLVLQENLDQLTKKNNDSVQSISQFRTDISRFNDYFLSQNKEIIQEIELISSRFTTDVSELAQRVTSKDSAIQKSLGDISNKLTTIASDLGQRVDKVEVDIRNSKKDLGDALMTLHQQLIKHRSDLRAAIQVEQTNREDLKVSILAKIEKSESAFRVTIGELNQHLLKRILQVAGGLLIFQIFGLGYLAVKVGLLKF